MDSADTLLLQISVVRFLDWSFKLTNSQWLWYNLLSLWFYILRLLVYTLMQRQCLHEWPGLPFSAANISSQSSLSYYIWGEGPVFANSTSQFSDKTKILDKVFSTLLCPTNIVRARKATQYDIWKHSTDVLWKSWDTSGTPSSVIP